MNKFLTYADRYQRTLTIGFFFFGIWYFCLRILGTNLQFLPGDLGDSRFINFLLEHGYQWALGNTDGFWSASFMFPVKNTIAFSDSMLGTMPIYGMFRTFGFNFETSYQLWWISIYTLNFWITFIVLKKWFTRWDIALIGAWIFAFSIFNLGQINYMQMSIRFIVPIVIYAAARLVETSQLKYFIYLSLGLTFQFYSVMYTGFFLFYFTLGFIFLYALVSKKYWFFIPLFKGRMIIWTLAIGGFSVALLLILLIPYYETSQLLGLKMYHEVKWSIPTFKSYLFSHESSYVWSNLLSSPPTDDNWWLHYSFPGILPFIALIIIPIYWVNARIKKIPMPNEVLAISMVAFILLLLFVRTDGGLTLYGAIFKFPGMNSMRVLNRYWHVELFFVLLFGIYIIRKMKFIWFFPFMIFVVIDNSFDAQLVPRESKLKLQNRTKSIEQIIDDNKDTKFSSFAIVSTGTDAYKWHLDAMIISQRIGIPTINGYSSSCPDAYGDFFNSNTIENKNKWLQLNKLNEKEVLTIYELVSN